MSRLSFSRRVAAFSIMGATASFFARAGTSDTDDFLVNMLPDGKQADFIGSTALVENYGTNPPTSAEQKIADTILANAVKQDSPIKVARYFISLEGNLARYKGGWPDRWNPIIYEFFKATHSSPEGDITPWCAAFVNWCLMSKGKPYTVHAASGSFLSYGTATTDPQPGDLVVFRQQDPVAARQLLGHVGFYVDRAPGKILVLGGNQVTKAGHHEISEVWFKEESNYLIFASYRSVP